MQLFTRGTWGYAVLLIILCAIATIAVWQTLSYLENLVLPTEFGTVAVLLWTLTLGFMLTAGAFGLWAIQFSSEAESRLRIAQLVDTMDYLRDGLIAVDRKGRITGSNPAARELIGGESGLRKALPEVFPCLTEADMAQLLKSGEPREVERTLVYKLQPHVYRFRSQSSRGITLLLVSDVTAMEAQRAHGRQVAKLQLIGQVARGVAYDFNNLLCGIASHAVLLPRLPAGSEALRQSLQAIASQAEKGVSLAAHLLEFSQPGSTAGPPTRLISDHIRVAATVVRDSLPAGWQVEVALEDTPPTVLSGLLIEQIVTNLALVVAGAATENGLLTITAGPPNWRPLLRIGDGYAGGIVIAATGAETSDTNGVAADTGESGVIQSVIRSILEEAGGGLDLLTGADGRPIRRVRLPLARLVHEPTPATPPSFDLAGYVAGWSVILARRRGRFGKLDDRLRDLGLKVETAEDIAPALARIEKTPALDAMVFDWALLGAEADGLLSALERLYPGAGIVVLGDPPRAATPSLKRRAIFVPEDAAPSHILTAMVEAKNAAAPRTRKA